MKKWWAFILFLLLLISPLVVAQSTNSSDDTIANAYQCLENKFDDKGTSLALEEAVFGTLALGLKSDFQDVIDNLEDSNCWPKPNCKIKDTAQVLLAYDRANKNTNDIEDYLLTKNKTATDLDWFLLTDIEQQTPATCNIRYDGNDHSFSIDSDMKLSGNPGSCLSIIDSGYWMQIDNTCLDKEFQISCDGFNGDFITTLLYKKSGSDVVYVSPNTNSAPSSGTTTESINAQCFRTGSSCDYEGSLWATLALQKAGYDVSDFMPYLFALADDNKEVFPSSFIYIESSSQEHYSSIVDAQSSDGFWQAPNTRYNKFYDTALGLLALQNSGSTEEQNAKDYLLQITTPDGCWNNNNLRDTAFLLYAGWPHGVYSSGSTNSSSNSTNSLSCISSGKSCGDFFACQDAGGQILNTLQCPTFGDFCCSVPVGSQDTCASLGGVVCASSQSCSGSSVPSLDGTCCLSTCQDNPNSLTNECEQNYGICASSCNADEQQTSYVCDFSSDVCCISNSSGSTGSGAVWWIILLLILIILVVLGIVFRNKLKLWIFKARSKGGIKSSSVGPRRPPFSPPGLPLRGPPIRRPPVRPQPVRQSRVDKEMEETLEKLREMSK